MKGQLAKKLGPLELWQWILVGGIVGVATILYRRGHAGTQNAAAAATPSSAQYNPIDPTTGMPVAGGVSAGMGALASGPPASAGAAGTASLTDLLTGFGQVEGLLAGLTQLQGTSAPAAVSAGPATETSPAAVQTQVGTKKATTKKAEKKPPKPRKSAHGGHANPGHQLIGHGGGKQAPTSSAPHNARQHEHVHPPHHQRHDPTRHPSADHPAAKKSGAGATPAAHPPAQTGALPPGMGDLYPPPATTHPPVHPVPQHVPHAHPHPPARKRKR